LEQMPQQRSEWEAERRMSVVGTPTYVAPEVILADTPGFPGTYGPASDWWSFGIVLYQMLVGGTPFHHPKRPKTLWNVLHKVPQLPSCFDPPTMRIIEGLLQRNPLHRLGGGSETTTPARAILGHPFFKGLDWERLLNREIEGYPNSNPNPNPNPNSNPNLNPDLNPNPNRSANPEPLAHP
jgi:serine/threonine protein kinase